MKLAFLILLASLVFLMACSAPQASQTKVEESQVAEPQVSAQSIIAQVINNPSLVGECDKLEIENRQICYSTYMALKAQNEESFDVSICDKIKPEKKEACNLYLAILKTN